jgi:hypothetical protein
VAFTAVRNWEFVRPLFFGDTVFVETSCLEKHPAGRRNGRVIWQRQLINQSQHVVQQGSFETLVAMKNSVKKPRFDTDAPSGAAVYSNPQPGTFDAEDVDR